MKQDQKHEALLALYRIEEILTGYLVENVPDGENWEDYFPEIDDARGMVQELIEELNHA